MHDLLLRLPQPQVVVVLQELTVWPEQPAEAILILGHLWPVYILIRMLLFLIQEPTWLLFMQRLL